jgi:hypothetical protein
MRLGIRHLTLVAAAGLVAVLLGCGPAPDAGVPGTPTTTADGPVAKGAPSVRSLPIPTVSASRLRSLTDTETSGLVSVAWSLLKLSDTDRAVSIVVELGSCRQVRGSQVKYTETAVTVAVFATPPPPGLCTLEALHLVALVPLREAVGNRPLQHAPASSVG